MKTKIDHRHSNTDLKTLATIQYKPGKSIKYNMILKKDLVKPIKLNAKIDLTYPGRAMSFSNSLIERSANNYHHEMIAQWQKNKKLRTMTVFTRRGNKYEVKSELTLPKTNPITLTGNTVLDKKDFSAAGAVEYNAEKYGAGVTYGYNFEAKPAIKGSIDLLHPSRHITAESQMSKVGKSYKGRVDVKWNADKNEKERLFIDGALLNAKQKAASLKMKYPGRTVTVNMNHNNKADKYISHAEFSYSPENKISADSEITLALTKAGIVVETDIRLVTPFEPIKNVKMSLKHKSAKEKHNSNLRFSWTPGKEIQASSLITVSGLKAIDGKLSVSTPFKAAEQITATLHHKLSKAAISSNAQFGWNKETVGMQIEGKNAAYKTKQLIDGSIEVTSSFPAFQIAAIRSKNKILEEEVTSHNEIQWNKKVFSLDSSAKMSDDELGMSMRLRTPIKVAKDISMSVKHTTKATRRLNEVEIKWDKDQAITYNGNFFQVGKQKNAIIKVSTPFKSFEKMSLSLKGEVSKNKVKVETEATRGDKKAKFELDAGYEGTYYARDIHTNIVLKSPYNSDLLIDIAHHNTDKNIKSTVEITHQGKKKIDLLLEGDMTDAVVGKVELKTPFKHMKDMSAAVNVRTQNPFTGHVELQWAPTKKISMDGELTYRGLTYIKGELRGTSTFSGFERIVLSGQHSMSSDKYDTSASLQYPSKKKIEISSMVNLKNGIVWDMDFTSPFEIAGSFSFSGKHRGKITNLVSEIKVNHVVLGKFSSKLRAKSLEMVNGHIHLENKNAKYIDAKITHGKIGGEWSTKATYEMSPSHKIEYTSVYDFNDKIKINAALTSTYDIPKGQIAYQYENGKVTGMLNIPKLIKETTFEANLDSGKSFITADMKIEKPSSSFKRILASLNHQVTGNGKYTTTMSGEYAGKSSKFSTSISAPSIKNIEITGNVEHLGKSGSLNARLVAPSMKKIEISSNIAYEGTSGTFTASLKAPSFRNIEATSTLEYDGTSGSFNTILKAPTIKNVDFSTHLQYAGETVLKIATTVNTPSLKSTKIDGSLEFAGKTGTIAVSLAAPSTKDIEFTSIVNTPFNALQTAMMKYTHKGSSQGFKCHGEIQRNNEIKSQLNINFDTTNKNAGSLTISTPYSAIRDFTVSFTHTGDLNAFTSTLNVKHNDEDKLQLTTRFSNYPKLEIDFSVTTPYEKLENIQINVRHEQSKGEFKNSLELVYNRERKIQFNSNLKYAGELSGFIQLKTPFENFEDLSAAVTHKGNMKNFRSHGEINYAPSKKIQIDGRLNSGKKIDALFQFRSPFQNLEDIFLSLDHVGSMTDFTCHCKFSYAADKKIKLDGSVKTKKGVTVDLTLASPFDVLKNLNVDLRHKGNMNDFTTHAELALNDRQSNVFDITYSKTDSEVKGAASINKWKVDFSHAGTISSFTTKANALIDNESIFKTAITLNKYDLNLLLESMGFTLKGQFQSENLSGRFTLVTPYTKKMMIVFSHQLGDNIISHHELSYGSDKYQLDVEQMKSLMGGSVHFQSPIEMIDDLAASYKISKVNSDVSSEAEFVYRKDKKITLNGEMKGTSAGLRLRSNIHEMARDISVSGSQNSIMAKLEASINDEKYSAKIERHSNQIKLYIETGFEGYEQMSAVLFHRFNERLARVNLKVNKGRTRVILVDLDAKIKPTITVSFELQTPLKYIKNIEMNLKHTGRSPYDFQTNADISIGRSKRSAELQSKWTKVSGLLTTQISTPSGLFAQEFHHAVSSNGFTSNLKVTLNSETYADATVDFKNAEIIQGSVKLRYPTLSNKDLSASFRHSGSKSKFNTFAELSQGEKTVSSNLMFDVEENKEIKLTVTSPNREVILHGQIDGKPTDFTSEISLQYATGKVITLKSEFKNKNRLQASASLTTPFDKIKNTRIMLNHNGDISEFNTNAYIMYGSDKIEWNSEYKSNEGIPVKGSVLVKSTLEKLENVGMEFDVSKDYDGTRKIVSSFKWARGKTVSVTSTCKFASGYSRELEASITVSTPFKKMQTASSKVYYKLNRNDYMAKIQAELNGNEMINGVATYKLNRGSIVSSLDVNIKQEKVIDLNIDAKYERIASGYSSSLKMDLNKKQLIDGDVEFQKDSAKIGGALTMRTPLHSSIRSEVLRRNGVVSASTDVNFDTEAPNKKIQIALSGKGIQQISVRLQTPTRTMAFNTETSSSSKKFQHKTLLAWDEENQKQVAFEVNLGDISYGSSVVYSMTGKLETPIRTMAVSGNTNSGSGKCNTDLTIQWDAERQPDKKLTLKTQYTKEGEQHNTVFVISHPDLQRVGVIIFDMIV